MSIASDAVKDNKKILLLAFGLLAVSVIGLILTREGMVMPDDNLVQTSKTTTISEPELII
jgi:hypothetical protein